MQDIKPLLVFAAVLEHGSMNAAAAALGMTPSAVSQHINRLETLHGIKLLNRSTRSLSPTDAGRALGEYCRRLAATLADTRTVIDNLKTEPLDSDFKCNTRVPVVGTDLRIKHLAFRSQVFFLAGGSTHLEPCVSPDC